MATHSSILFFFTPKSLFIHSKGPHHSNTHQFPENFSPLIIHFPSYVLQKRKTKGKKHTSLVRCAGLGGDGFCEGGGQGEARYHDT